MKTIERKELQDMLEDNEVFTLIDVLPEEEFNKAHIPGSLSIPFTDSDSGFSEEVLKHVDDKDEKLVVYCAKRECSLSRKAAQALDEAGFRGVLAYEDGMADWTTAGMPTESGVHA